MGISRVPKKKKNKNIANARNCGALRLFRYNGDGPGTDFHFVAVVRRRYSRADATSRPKFRTRAITLPLLLISHGRQSRLEARRSCPRNILRRTTLAAEQERTRNSSAAAEV